jgi:quercetin dioxygenase-like cupin family protein
MPQQGNPEVVPPAGGRRIWVLGELYTFKVTGEESGGSFAVWETFVNPGSGPPPHIHHGESEAFYVLSGEFEFVAGNRTIRGGPGSLFHAPKGTIHTFRNVSESSGKTLTIVAPAGFERFFFEFGEPATTAQGPPSIAPPNSQRLVTVARKYGCEILMPSH